jgi:hypothetical protein
MLSCIASSVRAQRTRPSSAWTRRLLPSERVALTCSTDISSSSSHRQYSTPWCSAVSRSSFHNGSEDTASSISSTSIRPRTTALVSGGRPTSMLWSTSFTVKPTSVRHSSSWAARLPMKTGGIACTLLVRSPPNTFSASSPPAGSPAWSRAATRSTHTTELRFAGVSGTSPSIAVNEPDGVLSSSDTPQAPTTRASTTPAATGAMSRVRPCRARRCRIGSASHPRRGGHRHVVVAIETRSRRSAARMRPFTVPSGSPSPAAASR